MRAKALLSLAGAFIAAVALVSASGAATTKAQKVNKINVSTRAAVVHYLRSIHVNPKGAVIQRGLRNYAGARCPGKHWACASTKHTVVQIAKPGGQNRFVCRSNHCVVVQISGVSHGVYFSGRQLASTAAAAKGGSTASCVKTGSAATTGSGQSCTINQSGSGPNTAAVYQNSMKVSGLTAAAAYTALITQQVTSGNNGNTACVLQSINLDGSTTGLKGKPVAVTLDAHQSVKINQDVIGSGANNASQAALLNSGGTTASCDPSSTAIAQTQILTSTVNGTSAITQKEDNSNILCGDGTANPANLCIDIEQNQSTFASGASGPNTATFDQENQLVALANTAAGGSIAQTQGNPTDSIGGLSGKVNQRSSAKSTFTATQNETQCEDAFKNTTLPTPTNPALCDTQQDPPPGITLAQNQYGPEGMGYRPTKQNGPIHYTKVTKDPSDSSQTGNSTDSFTVTQKSTQNNDNNAVQNNHITGGALTSGNGTVTQNAIIQNNNKENVQIGTSSTVAGSIDCTGSTKSSCTKTLSTPVITQKPTDPSAYGSGLRFDFSNVDPTVDFRCSLDGGAFVACSHVQNNANSTTGYETTSNLASGQHTFQVETKDADNASVSTPTLLFTWVITPPNPSITSTAPPNPDSFGNSYSFTFTDADSTAHFKCSVDGGTFNLCTSPFSFPNTASGAHSFTVQAYDHTNVYPSTGTDSQSWVITPPDPTITSAAPSNPDFSGNTYTFTFTDTDSTVHYQCQIDSQPVTSCNSGTSPTYPGLAAGSHTFSVTAYDQHDISPSNNPATSTWTILPLSVDALGGDGSSAGWACQAGGPIGLTVGTDPETYAQVTLDDAVGVGITGLSEPTFTTDNYAAGSPRWEIYLSNGDFLFGYPPNSGLNGLNFGWSIYDSNSNTDGLFHPWSDVLTAESGTTVTDALVIADGDQSAATTDKIGNLKFNGTTYNSGTCS